VQLADEPESALGSLQDVVRRNVGVFVSLGEQGRGRSGARIALAEACERELMRLPGSGHGLLTLAIVDEQMTAALEHHDPLGDTDITTAREPALYGIELAAHFHGAPPKPVHAEHQQPRVQGLLVSRPERGESFVERLLGCALRGIEVLQIEQARADQREQLDAQLRARTERVDTRPRLLQQVRDGERLAGTLVRIGIPKRRGEEFLDLARATFLQSRRPRLPQGEHGTGEDRDQHRTARGDTDLVPAHELREAIAQAVWLSKYRTMCEEALDVLDHRVDSCVALFRPLLESLEDDRVEVASQAAARAGIRDGVTRPRRFDPENCLLERTARAAFQLVGPGGGEQLVEHDAERVHIGRRRDGIPQDLFR
jgi:nucleotide-binding universal stress UspA family protein